MNKLNKQKLKASFMLENQKPTMVQLVKQTILRALDQIKNLAPNMSPCYQPESCIILDIDIKNETIKHFMAHRGPPTITETMCEAAYNCSCIHAETRAILLYLKLLSCNRPRGKTILITASQFWPCESCTQIILDSKVIDLIVCEEGYTQKYIAQLTKAQLESNTQNQLLNQWLYN